MHTARSLRVCALVAIATSAVIAAAAASAAAKPFIERFATIRTISSAVPKSGPAKGDVNPYGVAVVPHSTGKLVRGDVLVSNFNDAHNDQGTGSSIVEISPSGKPVERARCRRHDGRLRQAAERSARAHDRAERRHPEHERR
jgi:hypothetical protein